MALQILQKGPSAMQGALLGLGQGLQELASQKLAQMRQANEQAEFAKLLKANNIPDADIIARLPLKDRFKALDPFLGQKVPGQTDITQTPATNQPVQRVSVVEEEPTIYSSAARQQSQQLAGQQQPQQQQPQLPSSYDMAQELRRNALGFPETFTPESVKDLIKQFESFGHQFSPQQRANIEQQAADIMQNPQKMAALQQQYDQAVKNNETMELRRPGYTGQAVPLQQLQQPGQPLYRERRPKPLTEAQAFAKEAAEERRIAGENKPFKDIITKDAVRLDELDDKVSEWERLLSTGKVASGLYGSKVPRWFQNAETRRFDQIGDEVAALLAGGAGSVAGIGKMRFYKGAKPSIDTDTEAQRMGIEALRHQIDRRKAMIQMVDNLEAKNDYRPVKGLAAKVRKLIKDFSELPEPSELNIPETYEAVDDKTGEIFARVSNGKWQPV